MPLLDDRVRRVCPASRRRTRPSGGRPAARRAFARSSRPSAASSPRRAADRLRGARVGGSRGHRRSGSRQACATWRRAPPSSTTPARSPPGPPTSPTPGSRTGPAGRGRRQGCCAWDRGRLRRRVPGRGEGRLRRALREGARQARAGFLVVPHNASRTRRPSGRTAGGPAATPASCPYTSGSTAACRVSVVLRDALYSVADAAKKEVVPQWTFPDGQEVPAGRGASPGPRGIASQRGGRRFTRRPAFGPRQERLD